VVLLSQNEEQAMIVELRDFPPPVVAFAGSGEITRQDYQKVLVPAVEAALKTSPKLRLYYELGPGLSGIEPGAMWEDFKIGVEHLTRWERIAIVTDVEWIKHTVRAFGFLMPARVRIFSPEAAAEARAWIAAQKA
jgi:SpoIIAA-like